MPMFDDREKAEERKWSLDQEVQFKIVARRNKLFGQWTAHRLGLAADAAEAYAMALVTGGLGKAHDDSVLDRVQKDLSDKGIAVTRQDLAQQLDRCQAEASAAVKGG